MRIAPNIHRLDPGGGLVNVYLLDDGGQVTIIDAGAPRYFGALPAELAAMGRSLEDVRTKVHYDLEYIRRQSVTEDLRIMLKTVPVILLRRGGW